MSACGNSGQHSPQGKYIFELRLKAFFGRKGILGRSNSICKDTKEHGTVKGLDAVEIERGTGETG